MKPLARSRVLALVAILAASASCDRAPEIAAPLAQSDASSANAQAPSPGNSAKSGQIAPRILLDKNGRATFEIRTGTFDNAAGVGVADGRLEKVHYKVYDASGKQILTSNVNFSSKAAPTSYYSEIIPLLFFDPNYTVTVQANLRGVAGDGKRTDVVRGPASVFLSPDLDLRPQSPVQVGFGADVQNPGFFAASSDVKVNTATAFQVLFSNTGPAGSSSVAATASCSVRVFEVNLDLTTGAPVAATTIPYKWWTLSSLEDATPAGASWSSSTSILLPADGVAGCRFILSLAGLGTTKRVVVTINNLSPGDYDTTNNTVTTDFNVVGFTPATPPPEGQALGQAYEVTAYDGANASSPGTFVGIVRQQLDITGLSALVVDDLISTGTFTLRIKMGTAPALANGNINVPALVPMADFEWTGPVQSLLDATGGCLASNNAGTSVTHLAVNLGLPTNTICVDPVAGGLLQLRVQFNWTTPSSLRFPGGVAFEKFARFNVNLTFSANPDHLGANANMKLTDRAFSLIPLYAIGSPGYTFGVCLTDPCPLTINPVVEAVRAQSP